MVIANESVPAVADVVLVIEGTANLGAYITELRTNYIIPTLEYFNGGTSEDREFGSESSSTLFALVVFYAADCAPEPAVTCFASPTASIQKFISWLERIPFIGGAAEAQSHIAEGFATALQAFEDFQNIREPQFPTQKHCILVCNSPPYPLPCMETVKYNGLMADQLAGLMAEKNINCSIISPRKIPALLKLYDKAGGELQMALNKNYTKDRRHLVLLRNYQLQERPISPASLDKDKQLLPPSMDKSLLDGQVLSPGRKRPGSPLNQPPFKQPNTGIPMANIGQLSNPVGMMQPTVTISHVPHAPGMGMGPPTSLPGQVRGPSPGLPGMSPSPGMPPSMGPPQPPGMGGPPNPQGLRPQLMPGPGGMGQNFNNSSLMGPPNSRPPHMAANSSFINQPNPPNVTISRGQPVPVMLSQPVDAMSGMPRMPRDPNQGGMGPRMPWNAAQQGIGIGPGANQGSPSQLQQQLSQPGQPGVGIGGPRGLMNPGGRPMGPPNNQSGPGAGMMPGPMNSGNNMPAQLALNSGGPGQPNRGQMGMGPPSSTGPRHTLGPGMPGQTILFQHLQQPGSNAGGLPPGNQQQINSNQPVVSSSASMPPSTTTNINTSGGFQTVMTFQGPGNNMMGLSGPPTPQATGQNNGNNPTSGPNLPGMLPPSQNNPGLAGPPGGQMNSMQLGIPNANLPQNSMLQGNQNNPALPQSSGNMGGQQQNIGGPQLKGRSIIWQGVLEWLEKPRTPNDNAGKVIRMLQCYVSAAVLPTGEAEINAERWPQKLVVQLIPKMLMTNFGSMYLKHARNVVFHFNSQQQETAEAVANLNKVMISGFVGCVHFSGGNVACDIRILMLLYSVDKQAYVGFIPTDQVGFVNAIKTVIATKQKIGNMNVTSSGPPNSSSPGPGIPSSTPVQAGVQMGNQGQGMTGPGIQPQQTTGVGPPGAMNIMGASGGAANPQQGLLVPPGGPNQNNMGGMGQSAMNQSSGNQQGVGLDRLSAERQQNQQMIRQLQQTLEAAQQKELQLRAAQEQQNAVALGGGIGMQQMQQPQQQQRFMHQLAPNTQPTSNPQLRHLLQIPQQQHPHQMLVPGGPRPQLGSLGKPQQSGGAMGGGLGSFGDDL